MRIAVIGAGAMGSIYGGRLSQHNEVILVDTNQDIVEHINKNGLLIDENDTTSCYHPMQSAIQKKNSLLIWSLFS